MATNLNELIDDLNGNDIPTNIFTAEDEDPMVILGKLNEVIAYLETLRDTITSSDTKANEALAKAIQAIADASQAITTANGIDAKATQALTNANAAVQASTQAISSANTALSTANTAISTANSAEETAQSAEDKADNAVSTANTANTTATIAKNTAEGIDGKATQALTNSQTAISTANNAEDKADTAISTANTANTNASNAVSTANNAETIASSKQDALNASQLNAVNSGVTSNTVSQVATNASNISSLQTSKQDVLTFDSAPTSGSPNPVTSGGVYTALSTKQTTLTAGDNITIQNNVISATGGGGGGMTGIVLVNKNEDIITQIIHSPTTSYVNGLQNVGFNGYLRIKLNRTLTWTNGKLYQINIWNKTSSLQTRCSGTFSGFYQGGLTQETGFVGILNIANNATEAILTNLFIPYSKKEIDIGLATPVSQATIDNMIANFDKYHFEIMEY